ncbi:MAG: sigma-70 family RNA polymerase sigma factor [Myxococcaceae bacterium]|nr:sigma-70 family RNA polymerase sigma factor [Myxococcaceae bacterium]
MDVDVDAQAMLRVAGGDRAAFASLFDRHQARVVRFCMRFVGDRARAEELAQDVFIKLFRSARAYRPTAKFKTFLFRVAANHCLNEVRRGEYRVEHTVAERPAEDGMPATEPEDVGGARPDEAMAGRELERAVQAALAGMSERERAAFCMARFEGMAYRDIADALEASEAAVKSLIHRATLAVAKAVAELQAGTLPARSRA